MDQVGPMFDPESNSFRNLLLAGVAVLGSIMLLDMPAAWFGAEFIKVLERRRHPDSVSSS